MSIKLKNIVLGVICLFFCACSTKDYFENAKEIVTPLPTITQAVEPTNAPNVTLGAMQRVEVFINDLNKIDWTELEGYVNEEDSLRNSNMSNYGYLTYDNERKIYYINLNDQKLYVSDAKGEESRLICETSADYKWLQLEEEWLYYSGNEGGLGRVHLETGETEQITEKNSGIYFIDEGKIYFEDNDKKEIGFGTMDLEGNNREQLLDSRGYLGHFIIGDGFWFGKMTSGSDKILQTYYLVKFSEEKMEVLNQKGNFPLLAGKYFSMISDETKTCHIYNLETKEDVDLKVDTDKAVVSDGTDFYYWSKCKEGDNFFYDRTDVYCTISRWDGTTAEEIIKVDGAVSIYHLFLTPEMLYYLPHLWLDGKQVYQLWYYDLETGETGQIY